MSHAATDTQLALWPTTALALAHCSAITTADAELLREILQRWNNLSNLTEGDPGYHSMTDHCHDIFDAGECLADKLEKIAKASSPNVNVEPRGKAAPNAT